MAILTTRLAQQLIDWRQENGLSQAEASRRIGISRQTLFEIENGKRIPAHKKVIRKIHAATGLSPADWWEAA